MHSSDAARPNKQQLKSGMIHHVGNSNFILRRRKSEVMDKTGRPPVAITNAAHRPAPSRPSDSASVDRNAAQVSSARSATTESTAPAVQQRCSDQHKVIIYFGDSLSSKQQLEQAERIHHQSKGTERMITTTPSSSAASAAGGTVAVTDGAKKTAALTECTTDDSQMVLPSFVESVVGNVINIRIEGSFSRALDIVRAVRDDSDDAAAEISALDASHNGGFDWSFVQNWRSR